MSLREILASNLKRIRTEKSFSQKGMAETLGISTKLYNEIENSTANATLKTIEKIGEGLSIEPEKLFVGENTPMVSINSNNENGDTKNGIFHNDESVNKIIDKLIQHNDESINKIIDKFIVHNEKIITALSIPKNP